MGWDRKRRGAATGYYYRVSRRPEKPYPVKIYLGRGAAGHEAAAEVEKRQHEREQARAQLNTEREATVEADRLTDELCEWATVLSTAWLTLAGLHNHKGSWRVKRGETR